MISTADQIRDLVPEEDNPEVFHRAVADTSAARRIARARAAAVEGEVSPPKEGREEPAEDKVPPFSLLPLATTFSDFLATPLQPRRRLMGNWLFAGDLGAIIASRGSGKSWFSMLLAKALAMGAALDDWAGPDLPVRVGIFDSEMAEEDIHERASAAGLADAGENLLLLHYAAVLRARNQPINLACLEDQTLLIEWAKAERLEVLILDNLTTSVSGAEENNNDDFRDKVQPLLLSARAAGITLLLIGHLGKNGSWRGASGKEDLLDWTLKLTRDETSTDDVLVIKSTFGKFRRSRAGNGPLRWSLTARPGEAISFTSEPYSGPEAMLGLVQDGVHKPSEIAEELGVTASCVSKWGKKLADQGRLEKGKRDEWKLP